MRFILSVTLAAAALAAAAAFAQPAAADGRTPALSALSRYAPFPETTLSVKRAVVFPPTWDFTPNTQTGERVRIHLSKSLFFTPDSAAAQQWADFLDRLVHGAELQTLDAYLLTLREVQSRSLCGTNALACYGDNQIIAPAEDPQFDLSAQSVLAHEYGHHVAAHRLNDPWEAIDWGTKRWATYEKVCVKERQGVYFPGAEDRDHYFRNPGEGFAEAYRVLNEQLLGLSAAPWNIVTEQLVPDARALALLQQDVTAPWTKNTTLARRGSVSNRVKSRAFVISTPLDGRFAVRLTSSAKARFRLEILSPTGNRLGRAAGKNVSASTNVCGDRALRVRVNRLSGAGTFRLAISRP